MKEKVLAALKSGHTHVQEAMDVTVFLRSSGFFFLTGLVFLVLSLMFLSPLKTPEPSGRPLATLTIETEPLVDTSVSQTGIAAPETPDYSAIEDVVEGLTEETPKGLLPIIRKEDGLTPYRAYQAPFVLKKNTKAIVSIILTDFGMSDDLTEQMIENLPAGLTFSASPYAESLQHKISEARKSGHEIWLTLFIQDSDYPEKDTGSLTILSGLNKQETVNRLHDTLAKVTGYAGVSFTNSPAFPAQSLELNTLIGDISERGLGAVQLHAGDTIVDSIVQTNHKKLPYLHVTEQISSLKDKGALLSALDSIAEKSLTFSYAVVVLPSAPVVVDALQEWEETLADKNIQLAPLSYAIHQKNMMAPRE